MWYKREVLGKGKRTFWELWDPEKLKERKPERKERKKKERKPEKKERKEKERKQESKPNQHHFD